MWNALDVLETYPKKLEEELKMARTYSSMAYESANWVYVDLHFQTSDIIRNIPMASPIDTSVVSP